MAKRIWNKTRRLFKDGDAGPVTDGSVTVRVGGTSTPAAVYTDKSLSTVVSGSVVNFNSDGYLEISGNEVNLYVADDVTADLLIQATGFNGSAALTEEDAAIAESATVAEDYRTGFKNALSNGDFASWSGATSGSNASGDDDGDETADGWYLAQPSAASNEWSRQAAAGTGARYGYRFGRPSSSTSANEIRLWKILAVGEAYRLRGQTITVSFSAKAGANFSGSALSFKFATGTTENEDGDGIKAASWGGFSLASSQNVAITTTLTRYSYSFTVGSGIKEAGVQFAFTGSGAAGANDWVQIEDVQVEIAAAATAFEAPPEPITYILNEMTPGGRLLLSTTFTDPNADRLFGWDDSAGATIGFTLGSGLAFNGTAIDLDADLSAIAALGYTSGAYLIKKTAANTYSLITITSNAESLLADSSVPRLGAASLFATGNLQVGDSAFNATLSSGEARWNWDAGDYDEYVRASNARRIIIGGAVQFTINASSAVFANDLVADNIYFNTDNTYSFGTTLSRATEVWAVDGSINTSDATEKRWHGALPDGVKRAGKRILKGIGHFQWLASIEKKGDDARFHIGVLAQDVRDAFLAEGEDPWRWGLIGSDELPDGSHRLSLRPSELKMLLLAVLAEAVFGVPE